MKVMCCSSDFDHTELVLSCLLQPATEWEIYSLKRWHVNSSVISSCSWSRRQRLHCVDASLLSSVSWLPLPPLPAPYLQIVEEHCSVEQSRRAQAEPISLDSCLKAFTSEEELGEDELYYCSKCKTHRLATKKLDLWRLPPVLVSFLFCIVSCTCTGLHIWFPLLLTALKMATGQINQYM